MTDDLDFAFLDHEREERWGLPEAVLGIGKTPKQITEIVGRLVERNTGPVLVTKTTAEAFASVKAVIPQAEFFEDAKMIRVMRDPVVTAGCVGIIAAGTADTPIAEEAALTAECAGATVDRFYDVGVAGLHRLFSRLERIKSCDALVVVAGMEGALPTVVGGLTGLPIVAVPTSVGYGTSLGGVAALLGMLNSCTPQVVAVNIDNGFGGGFFAALITRKK
jgi:pyridinium-3,5-biscarboxylic acid mononucleotide synthase